MPPRTTELNRSARRLTRAMAACWAAGLAATAAHAEFVVNQPPPIPIDSNVPYFFTGPFNFSPEVLVTGGGVWSGTQYRQSRVSNLPTGPSGTAEALSAMADSGWITTTQSGQAAGAYPQRVRALR
jgi:hypothetical protein